MIWPRDGSLAVRPSSRRHRPCWRFCLRPPDPAGRSWSQITLICTLWLMTVEGIAAAQIRRISRAGRRPARLPNLTRTSSLALRRIAEYLRVRQRLYRRFAWRYGAP